MTDRQGIEIDYCPQCRGVWLDRGELDKIIERSEATATPIAPPAPPHQPQPHQPHPQPQYHDDRSYRHDNHGHQKKHKRESFIGDLFDF
jgi:Zn-finger nucleic acid-binding protein